MNYFYIVLQPGPQNGKTALLSILLGLTQSYLD